MSLVLKVLTVALGALWPLIVFGAVWADLWRYVLPVLAMLFGLKLLYSVKRPHQGYQPLVRAGIVISAVALTLCLLSLAFRSIGFMLYYPVAVNLIMLTLFATSLKGEQSLVERLARLQDPELSPRAVRYTRQVTQAWCLFFVVNGTIAAATALYGDLKLWTLWNGLLSYIALGVMFGGEYLLRQRLQARDPARTANGSRAPEGNSTADDTHAPAPGLTMPTIPLSHWLTAPCVSAPCAAAPLAAATNEAVSHEEALSYVSAVRAQLSQAPGPRVALVIAAPYDFALALLATLSLGQRPVILGHHKPQLLVQQQELFDCVLTDQVANVTEAQALGLSAPIYALSQLTDQPQPPAAVAATRRALEELDPQACFELYTSGSTGTPKRVLKTVGEMQAEATQLTALLGDKLVGATIVSTVFPYHMYGLTFTVFLPWSTQTKLHRPQIHYSEELAALPAQPYVLISSPAFLKRLDFTLLAPQLNAIISAGGPLPPETRAALQQWCGVTATEIYGSTEAGVMAWRQALSDDAPFTLFPDVTMRTTAAGTTYLTSGHVATDLTLDDRIELGPERTIKLLGRTDRIVKIEEKRVALNAIEATLCALPEVHAAAVTVVTRGGRDLIAAALVLNSPCLQPQPLPGATYLKLRRQLAAHLEPHALPRLMLQVPALPENALGKRDRHTLNEWFAAKLPPHYNEATVNQSQEP